VKTKIAISKKINKETAKMVYRRPKKRGRKKRKSVKTNRKQDFEPID